MPEGLSDARTVSPESHVRTACTRAGYQRVRFSSPRTSEGTRSRVARWPASRSSARTARNPQTSDSLACQAEVRRGPRRNPQASASGCAGLPSRSSAMRMLQPSGWQACLAVARRGPAKAIRRRARAARWPAKPKLAEERWLSRASGSLACLAVARRGPAKESAGERPAGLPSRSSPRTSEGIRRRAKAGAGGGDRTHTSFRTQDFKSCASASFATPAWGALAS